MTVKEVIEEFKKYDENLEVFMWDSYSRSCSDLHIKLNHVPSYKDGRECGYKKAVTIRFPY